MERRARSSSASGRLEKNHAASILSEKESPSVANTSVPRRRHDKAACDPPAPGRVTQDGPSQPEWLMRELLRQNGRRHSVTLGDEAAVMRRQHQRVRSIGKLCSTKHSDLNCLNDDTISLENLQKLKQAFEDFGSQWLDAENFGRILRKCLRNTSAEQIQGLFKKIDYSGHGRISWGQFCTHMLQEHKEKEESVRRSKQVWFTLPATRGPLGAVAPIVSIRSTRDGTVITLREDGAVCFWSPELRPLCTKHLFQNQGAANSRSKWASDFTVMTEYNKLMVATGDREIQIYDFSTLDPYCQISALDSTPLILDYGRTGPDECCILYGDTEGCVTILLIASVGDTLRLWNKLPPLENIPNITMDAAVASPNVTFVRWKIHQDWVTQVKYFPGFQAVVSASNEESSSVVVGCLLPLTDAEQRLSDIRDACYEGKTRKAQAGWAPHVRAACDQTLFNIYKGVKTFDLCEKRSLLVTGGMDRVIRLWNPHFSGKPTGFLKGHAAPIIYVCISSEDGRIFSVSVDRTVKIWDIQDQCCLFTADAKSSGIHGDVSACSYSPAMKSLFIAADCISALSLKMRPQYCSRLPLSHDEAVTCCGYSSEFRQVVSCTEGSVLKVWDFDTGRQVLEFGGKRDLSTITCMTFDLKGRRLITGGDDGSLKIWNFNNGQCLKTLKRGGECGEVCDCIFIQLNRNCFVMSVGRERKIDIYSDVPEDPHHVQRPRPRWPDDQRNGHNEDIMCAAQRPPALVATGSYDGEIILWNVITGRIQCRFVTPRSPSAEGLDLSVPCLLFLKNLKVSSATLLLSSGARGCINIWQEFSGGKLVSSFKASRFRQKITKLAKSGDERLIYAADRVGYIYIYDMSEYKSPRAENFWRAHTDRVTGLQVVDSDEVVLSSSSDFTVRLWSTRGEFIGTFGQSERWSVHSPSSWMHPAVPHHVLIHPLSLPAHENFKTHPSDEIDGDTAGADRAELKVNSIHKREL